MGVCERIFWRSGLKRSFPSPSRSLAAMIEFFVERVRSEKVRNGAGAALRRLDEGGREEGFAGLASIQFVGHEMDGSELFCASLRSPFAPGSMRLDFVPIWVCTTESTLTHCKLGAVPV